MMNIQKLFCCVMLLLLKITYFHVSAKQNYLVSEQWTLENMPFLSIIFAKSEYLPDGPCKNDAQKFLYDLLNGSIWATQMFDSSTKYPEGILYGHTRYLGNFDECYDLQVTIVEENANIREINGKYCFVNIEYKNEHAIPEKLFNTNPISVSKYQNETSNSFWNLIEQWEDFLHIRRNRLQLALCVPATCNAENLEVALRIPLEKLGANKNVKLTTTVQSCQTAKEAPKYTLGAGIYCAVLLVLLSLVIISTWYDSTSSKDRNHMSTVRNIMQHFSARKNYAKILHVNYTHTGLDSIHFIRLVNIIFVVYLHNLLLYIYNPIISASDTEKMYQNLPFFIIIINIIAEITVFFVIGGVLHATNLLKDLEQYKQLKFLKNVVSRYLRVTPLYAVIIGFYIWILPHLGSGPYWYLTIEECTNCVKNWWMNLLYVNNYLVPSELCVLHGWYLAADFQLFVCSQFVIYAFWRMPRKIGYPFLGILTLISCAIPFVATYIYSASSVVRVTPYTTKVTEPPEFGGYYIKGHMHITGYLVGIIAGAILHDHKGSTWRLSKYWSHILVCPIPLILYVLIQYWACKFFILDKTNLLEEAIFAFFLRLTVALCLCSTIVLLSIGSQSEFYYNFFTPRWIQPLVNLCYGVYLIHLPFIIIEIGQARTARTFRFGKTIWDTIPLLIVCFLLSLFVAICIEMPFRNLSKWLFSESSKIVVKEDNTIVVNDRISEAKVMKKE